ncbi:hypothetical protein CSOJ01_00865 [Colletotrichum sojae]|uniref:Uncharacterized protein n=1 Tax=Colletotrichum sojae TaxID=2175907 RepID=A0A8H6JW18_9PEZI|nr:hypothetical protein CSOJ01_00865 [Colletotrichum sojae]
MELHATENEPQEQAARPRPLRVLKRLGNSSREVNGRGTDAIRLSRDSDESLGSGPEQPERPLRIRKKRAGQHKKTNPGPMEAVWGQAYRPYDPDSNRNIDEEDTLEPSSDAVSAKAPTRHSSHHSQPYHTTVAEAPTSERETGVLVPRISVTPEVSIVEDKRSSIWVAIEVSAELSGHANGLTSATHSTYQGSTLGRDDCLSVSDPFQHGYIHDMSIKVTPVRGNRILETIQEEPTPSMLFLGVTVLLLVNVSLTSPGSSNNTNHFRPISDELIDDLETQLGSAMTEYLKVTIKYKHSAFPTDARSGPMDGVSDVGTILETSATAVVPQHNRRSPWSPCPAPTSNPLFAIIHQH